MRLAKLNKKLSKLDNSFSASIKDNCVVLNGKSNDWGKIVKAGQLAVDKKYLGVINDIELLNYQNDETTPSINDNSLDNLHIDVLVIGAGISGASVARELSKYKLDTLVIDKNGDVACGQSSRNGGVVHTGISFSSDSLKLKYCLQGNQMYTQLSKELDVPLHRYGQIMFIRHKYEIPITKIIMKTGIKKNVPNITYLSKDKLKEIDGAIPDFAIGGIHMASGGITCPYKMTVALAENAASNGVKFSFETKVLDMEVKDDHIVCVKTNRGTIYPKVVINAAGVFADKIAKMANDQTFTIHPRKGSYMVIDKKKGDISKTSLGKAPYTISPYQDSEIGKSLTKAIKTILSNLHSHSKGIGVIHTIDNNILLGPEALETPDRESTQTDKETIDKLFSIQHEVVPSINKSDIITYFSGVRSATYEEDFVVRQGIKTKNIFEMAGIQSPGITAAPAIAIDIAKWTIKYLNESIKVEENKDFNPIHKFPPVIRELDDDTRDKLIKENPDYGEIVCRCEEVSKGEIIDCLKSSLPVYNLDAVKRRVRPGMGRCQGGFCSPTVMKIISEVSNKDIKDITKKSSNSYIANETI